MTTITMMRSKLAGARRLVRLIDADLEEAERAHAQAVACCERIAELCRA